MREILFRAKYLDDEEWVEGFYVHSNEYYGKPSDRHFIIEHGEFEYADYSGCRVDPDTVGQYTGRKDLNSKNVFEHDILQLYTIWPDGTKEKSARVIVQWWENNQCYVLTTKEGYRWGDFGNYDRPEFFEVIGNIHDNPELLEVGNE